MHRRAMESMVDGAGIAASLFGMGLVWQVLRRDPGGSIGLFRAALPLAEEHTDRPGGGLAEPRRNHNRLTRSRRARAGPGKIAVRGKNLECGCRVFPRTAILEES